tara:strand:- start:596 stop:1213 length:618 start_codon:yes stop_codon:yes gene_type:complete
VKVGNIVNCNEEIDERYFNCLSIEKFMVEGESKLPTLIVGWDTVKKNFSEVSILSKIISPPTKDGYGGIYWTFSRKEKRGIYESNLKEFKEKCYEDLVKNLKTYNIDPIIYKINNTDELCTRILKLADGIGYLFQDRIVYIYKDNHIFMVDLELMEFIGFDKNQIVKTLTNNLSVFGDDFEEKYTEELKHLDIKYTPFLEFKNAI